jgi:hypothetical protein
MGELKELEQYKNAIIEVIDSFRKMCDFIEKNDNIGCARCPVFEACFYKGKHEELHKLIKELNIKR